MRPFAFALVVALVLPTLADATTTSANAPEVARALTPAEAVESALSLVARIGAYSARHPEEPGGCSAWAGRQTTAEPPLLVHTYPELEPSYYYVPLDAGTEATFVTIDATTGDWQAFGRRAERGPYPPVSRTTAASIAGAPGDELIAVGMPDNHTYWYHARPGGSELFVNVANGSDVHFGLDEVISPPELDYSILAPVPSGDKRASIMPGSGCREVSGGGRFPTSYDITGVPYHVQVTSYNCGPAAAEMVLDYWGADIYQEDIADVANCTSSGGSYNSDIRRCGHFSALSSAYQDTSLHGYDERKLGYAALDQWWALDGGTNDPDYPDRYNDLRELVSQDFPLLLLMKYSTTGGGHFRVLKGYNDSTSVFIAHDPWYTDPYQGPDVNFNQIFFVDTLWAGTAGGMRWATLMAPWEIEVQAPDNVVWGSTFTVTAIVYYHGPHPYESQDGASGRVAEIDTSPLFTLAPGETAAKTLPGSAVSGTGSLVTWSVVADTAELGNVISVVTKGYITDSSYSYSSYSDSIGGWGSKGVTIWDPDVIFVDPGGSGDFEDIQSALNASNFGDTIYVEPGTYTGSNNTNLDFGGRQVSLVSTGGPGSTIIDCEGMSWAFWMEMPVRSQVVIDGFTIRNGHPPGTSWPYDSGGGMFLHWSSPTIRNCIFENCSASNVGGAVLCLASSPVFEDCEFRMNFASGAGGGAVMCCEECYPEFHRCLFTGNWGDSQGGAVWTYEGPCPTFEHCTFVGNSTLFDGGALAIWESPWAVITDCTLLDNGGGNSGGISFGQAPAQVANTLIAYGFDGVAVECSGAGFEPSFQNCCTYGNALGDSLCGIYAGQGNIHEDPLLCSEIDYTYYLQDCSPCVGAGIGGTDIGAWPAGCPCGDPTGVDETIPAALLLHAARPTPFAGETAFALEVPADAGRVLLAIFNVSGRRVRMLVDAPVDPGVREFLWDGRDDTGAPVSAGVYFARCECESGTSGNKVVLLR